MKVSGFILRPKFLSAPLTSLRLTGSQTPSSEFLYTQYIYSPLVVIQWERVSMWLINLTGIPASIHPVVN